MKPHDPTRDRLELDTIIVARVPPNAPLAHRLRNGWRRMQLPENIRQEVFAKNILMIGPNWRGKNKKIAPSLSETG